MRKELPQHLVYHCIEHVEDVFDAARNIGKLENITAHEMNLLLTAAWYHDAGFILQANGHEEESCRIAAEVLPRYNYTAYEIEQICGLIMATRIPQSPQNHLEQIMADADLDYLGRDDYFTTSYKLYQELTNTGVICSEQDWQQVQIDFMEKHHYFTPTAINLRRQKKEENLKQIKANTILP
ncbi:HD domain-containing protein [Mucilaginibacter terrae]|uniref:HD domain-containing protein n=1 Tax=Mucilaginibacter terrae TaxID=1955052 RepID=UPI00363AA29F